MKYAYSTLGIALLGGVALAFGQAHVSAKPGAFTFDSDSIVRTGPVVHLSGSVVIRTDDVVIHAQQADFNTETQEVKAAGPVTVTFKNKP